MEKSSFDGQKNQYVEVMKDSLSIMQEAANGMLNSHLAELKNKLSDDLNTYLDDPNKEHKNAVMKDIKEIKNSD